MTADLDTDETTPAGRGAVGCTSCRAEALPASAAAGPRIRRTDVHSALAPFSAAPPWW